MMQRTGTKVWAARHHFSEDIDVLIEAMGDAGVAVAKPLMFEMMPDNSPRGYEPTMTLGQDAAQMLMDQLWKCGLRPSEGSGSAGALAAVEKHLADMRRIAFGRFGEKP